MLNNNNNNNDNNERIVRWEATASRCQPTDTDVPRHYALPNCIDMSRLQ
jgi:hypothetical protein